MTPFCERLFSPSLLGSPCPRAWTSASGALRCQRGMVLIGIIVVLFLVSALVVAMMSQSTSSSFSMVEGNSSRRAFYLAESGFRYAAARIKHGADMKSDLHLHYDSSRATSAFSLANNAGTFDLFLYPHYLVATGTTSSGATSLNLETPGGYDSGSAEALAFPVGTVKKIRIFADQVNYDQIHDFGTAALSDVADGSTGKHTATVTFNLITPAIPENLPSDAIILPVAVVEGGQTISSQGANLLFETGSASAFPKKNGTFRVKGNPTLYAYTEKDEANDLLKGLSSPLEGSFVPLIAGDGDEILLERFVRIKSVGTFQNASRTLTYHVPMATPEATVKFEETFDDATLANWESSTMGSHSVLDGALRVTGTEEGLAGAPKVSLIALKPAAAGLELVRARTNAAGFLGYEAQTKVGFHADLTPQWGFDPPPIPKYFAAGLSFRLDRSDVDGNYYGLSFLRGDNSLSSPFDNIPDPIVPQNGRLLLVLWQQTDLGSSRKWLAYKDLSGAIFQEKVESGTNGWTVSSSSEDQNNLWRISQHRSYSSNSAWWYGRVSGALRNYDEGVTKGSLVSPPINLCSAFAPVLKYATWHHTEGQYTEYGEDWQVYDLKIVELSTDDGVTWPVEIDRVPYYSSNGWKIRTVDLSPYAGQTVRIRFRFNSVDSFSNTYEGWYIDDVAIEYPVNEATIALRLQEGPAVDYSAGSGTSLIQPGDLIFATSGTYATVSGPVILSSGSWAGGDAVGTFILRNVNGTGFVAGDVLQAAGSSTTATVTSFRSRDNYIRAYLGSTGDCGGNSIATDQARRALVRGSFKWPSEDANEWPAINDFFTLVAWDAVNENSLDPSAPKGLDETISGQLLTTVIRTNRLPSAGTAAPELGLHALGHGATNVYFDDFAVKLQIGAQRRYAPVVQE